MVNPDAKKKRRKNEKALGGTKKREDRISLKKNHTQLG